MNQPTESPSPSPLRKSLTMERINAALWDTTMLQKVQILTQSCRTLIAELTALRLAVAQQQEDTRMLDWLEANGDKVQSCTWKNSGVRCWDFQQDGSQTIGECKVPLRAAIASAMSKENP